VRPAVRACCGKLQRRTPPLRSAHCGGGVHNLITWRCLVLFTTAWIRTDGAPANTRSWCMRACRRSKDDILAQIRDLQSEVAQLENRGSGPVDGSNKNN